MRSVYVVVLILALATANAFATGALVSALPDEARPGDELWVQVTGNGTVFGQGSGTTALLEIPGTATLIPARIQVVSSTKLHLELDIPHDQILGHYDIVITEALFGGDRVWRLVEGFYVGYPFDCGDMDRGGVIDIDDVKALITYVFLGTAAPIPLDRGDINCDRKINIVDISLLVKYLFRGGDHPCALCP